MKFLVVPFLVASVLGIRAAGAVSTIASPVAVLAAQNLGLVAPTLADITSAVTTATAPPSTNKPLLTLTVCKSGCAYASPRLAIAAALNTEMSGALLITVSIADGVYQEADQIYTESPLGKYISVVGDVRDNSKVVINFTNVAGSNLGGFVANLGGMFGYIDGLTINAVGAQLSSTSTGTVWNKQSYGAGISATFGSYIGLGPHVAVNHFYYGVAADNNAIIDAANGGVVVTDAGDVGFMARGNGIVICAGCQVSRVADTTPGGSFLGCGFDAERGGSLFINGSATTQTFISGICALTSGRLEAQNVVGSGGLGGTTGAGAMVTGASSADLTGATFTGYMTGIYASGGSSAVITTATVNGSSGDGVVADGGTLSGNGVTSSSNVGYGFHVFHQGALSLTASLANAVGNGSGPIASEVSGTQNGTTYLGSTASID